MPSWKNANRISGGSGACHESRSLVRGARARLMLLSIFAAARESPDRIGLITEDCRYTYSELAALVSGRAASLVDFPAPLLLQPQLNLDSLLWLYAAFATGTPFLSLDPQATAREVAGVQARTGASNPPQFAELAGLPCTAREIDPEAPFSMLLTSGSTGSPKVVVMSRAAVIASAAASASNLGVHEDDRWLLCLALSHVAGIAIIVRMLAARRSVVLFEAGPAGLLSRIGELGRRIHAERVTLVSLVPVLLDRLLRNGFRVPPTLRAVLLGGAGCSPDLAERARQAGVPLLTSYGLTETGSQIAARRYQERHSIVPEDQGCVSSGHPLADVAIKIVGDRIAVKTAALLSGYLGAAAPAVDAEGWFVTNDRGALGPQGELYVYGRADSTIITGGENVDPEEVERALRRLPAVQDVCVFGLPSREFGEWVVAVVVPVVGGPRLSIDSVTLELRKQLARFKLPRALVVAQALPLTASGKLDRRTCRSRFGPLFADMV
jgi:O-succinylbenzoic acid--CoA ligase